MDDIKNIPQIKTVSINEIKKIEIPECCKQGFKNCPHSVKQQKKVKINIGL